MDPREPLMDNRRSSGASFRSVSHHALLKEMKVKPPDGLKKLATNYRNSVKTNKLDLEKYRNVFKDKRTTVDPRFRRERTKSPKRANHSQSESKFHSAEKKIEVEKDKNNTSSAPTFPVSFRPDQPNKQRSHSTRRQLPNADDSPDVDKKDVKIETEGADKNDQATSMQGMPDRKKTINDFYETATGLAVPVTPVTPKDDGDKNKEERPLDVSPTNFIQLHCLNKSKDPYWEDTRFMRKYAQLLQPPLKKSKSSVTLPVTSQIVSESMCACTNCTEVKGPVAKNYVFDNTTEVSSNMFANRDTYLKTHLSSYHMAVFYAIGCICGLSLVALIAWVLSNEVIWSWVNSKREQPKPAGYFATTVAICSKAVLYTLNFLISTFMDFVTLPRNAVFSVQEESPPTLWSYFQMQ